MANFTFNPYPAIGTQLVSGMNLMAEELTPDSTVDDLVNAIYGFIQPIFYPTTTQQLTIEIKSVVYNVINAYNNQLIDGYNEEQDSIVRMFLGQTTTNLTPVNALQNWFIEIENEIPRTGLSLDEQTPLLLASEVSKTILSYWVEQVTDGSDTWDDFFQSEISINYANIPIWTASCIEGTLIGASASEKGLIAPTTDIVSTNIVSALIGALAIGAGKVIFKWVPRIQIVSGYSNVYQGGGVPFESKTKVNKKDCIVSNNCDGGNCTWGCSGK